MPVLPEPTWPQLEEVQKTYADQSATCNRRFTPTVVTGILLRVLQSHFSSTDNIRDEKLHTLIWSPDAEDGTAVTALIIDPLYKYDPAHMQDRPAIYVFRQALSAQKLPMNSKYTTSLDANGNYSGEKFTVPLSCRHVLRIIAKTAFAAERIAEEVFFYMLEFQFVLKQDFPFSEVAITTINPPQKLDEANENFIVDVALEISIRPKPYDYILVV